MKQDYVPGAEDCEEPSIYFQRYGDSEFIEMHLDEWPWYFGGPVVGVPFKKVLDGVADSSTASDKFTPPAYDRTRGMLRIPRFQFPKPVGVLLDLFIGSIESGVRFVIQLLATSIIWMDFLFP